MSSTNDMDTGEVSAEELEILAYLMQQERQAQSAAQQIKPRQSLDAAPLSFAQERLWLLDQLEPGNAFYNVPLVLDLQGQLDTSALSNSLQLIVSRHDSLRTRFVMREDQPVQLIDPDAGFELPKEDISALPEKARVQALAELIKAEALQPFNLEKDRLVRAKLVRKDQDDHVLLFTLHHIVSDGWSVRVLFAELTAAYTAFSAGELPQLPELPIQYADFAAWQRNWLSGEVLESQLVYWRQQLANLPTLQLPTDRPRPPAQTFNGAMIQNYLSSQFSSQLSAFARQQGVSLYMILLTAFSVLLNRYSGQQDIVIGSPIANRNRSELEGLIGFFVNSLVMRTDLSGNPDFTELVQRVNRTALGAYDHQDLPFEKLVDEIRPERDRSQNPLFQVMFALQNTLIDSLELDELRFRPVIPKTEVSRFDLEVQIRDGSENLGINFIYNTDLFDQATIERMFTHYQSLLETMVASPQMRIADAPMLGVEERQQLVDGWNQTKTDYPREQTVQSLFAEQVLASPDAIALEYQDQTLSYRELNQRANQLAHYLQSKGVGAEVMVGVSIERSLEMVVGLLAIVKAGGAYVPLDPDYPQSRLGFMLEDAAISTILTTSGQRSQLPPFFGEVICVDTDWPTIAKQGTDNPLSGATADNLIYVIYTSGSTGQPKGTLIEHRSAVRLVRNTSYLELGADEVFLQFAPIAFDASTLELWGSLLNGAKLVIFPAGRSALEELGQVIVDKGVTTLWLTSALFSQMVDNHLPSLAGVKQLLAGGEALSLPQVKKMLANLGDNRLINGYGPTENTTFTCCHVMTRDTELGQSVPIGRPISNTTVYILDAQMSPVPIGIPGELYVGGDGLARGYLNQPEMTAQKFVADPFSADPQARLYATGDQVRYRTDGSIEFIGRIDHQVKLRGYRIELGEIENALIHLEAVSDAVVIIREDDTGDKRLDAYVVPSPEWVEQNPGALDGAGDSTETEAPLHLGLIPELRQKLRQQLPAYMLPSVYLLLDALPLNPNGKVDRKALPILDDVPAIQGAQYTAPRNELEQHIAAIWAEVLKLERVGIHDNFFDLGGHSLMATQVVSRVRAQLNLELPLSEMFGYPTVAELSPEIETLLGDSDGKQVAIIPLADRSQALPLSFAQERLWFLDQLQPGNPAYNIPMVLRLQGELSIAELTHALNEILQRHEVLRTRFVDSPRGPIQMIDALVSFDLVEITLSDLSAEVQQQEVTAQLQREAICPFDLAADLLLRGTLLRLGEHEHVLLLTLHHIIADGWSLGVLFRELGICYAAFSENRQPQLPILPIQYADFAVWQRDWLSGTQLQRQLDYWRRQLADLTTLDLPTDYLRPPMQSYGGAPLVMSLGKSLSEQLEALSKRSGNTLFMTLLGAYALMLHRYSAQDDVVIGSPIANRNRSELEDLIAFFVNMLVLRVDCSGNPGFAEYMERLNGTVMGAFEHQDIPFEKLVEAVQTERDPSRNPLFQVHFALQNAPMERLQLAGLTLESVSNPAQVTRFDLECHIWPRAAELEVIFIYNTDLFEAATIERMLGHFRRLLESIVVAPDQAIDSLAMQSGAEKDLLLRQWNQTDQDYAQGLTLQQLFAAQVARSPEAVALEYGDQCLSYAELDALANRLAHRLQAQGVGPGQLVGVHMRRSLEMVIALYAIVKAGGAYVPLDPDYPQDRIAYMAAEAELQVLLTQAELQADLPELEATVICVDHAALSAEVPVAALTPTASADDLAYVIYTSGSTGKPKGVMNCHSGIVNRLQWMQQAYALTTDDRVLQKTPYSFDVSVWEFFWPLITGARLVIAEPEGHKDPVYLSPLIKDKQISTLHFVPSMLKVFLDNSEVSEFASVKRVICSGEALPYELQQQFFSLHRAELHNLYGPTEAAVDVSYWACRADDERHLVPIGHPVANTQLYILDHRMQPVPIGVSGELYIGGVQVAQGYLGQPELTAEKFIADPFSDRPGARLYRTGDLARYLADGAIEYLGRIDNQIKLRGLRIELGEIETELGSHQAVREVVVVAREDQPGDKRLVAYLVAAQSWLEQFSATHSGEHVGEWQTLYEQTYRQGDADRDARFNIVSWNSSYTGEPIAAEQMREWVEVTVARIAALQAQRVLEIGCGTGLLLYRLAPACTRYVGADFSAVVQHQLQKEMTADEALRHVELWHRRADDFSGVGAGDFDLVVINSVVQYLPTVDYLLSVLAGAVAAVGAGGQVFVGDLRSFALLGAYHASVEAHRAAQDVSVQELLASVQQRVEEENELVLEPAFFHALKQRIARVSHVEVLLKRGEHINELSAFRYDVILHVEAQPTDPGNGRWHDWGLSGYNEVELQALLSSGDQDWLGIHAIPNARTAGELALLEQLQGDHSAQSLSDLQTDIEARVAQAVDPAHLWRIAASCGYELELGYAGSGVDGCMEALFRRGSRADNANKLFWDQAQTPGERRWSDYASNPLKGRLARELVPQLKDGLCQILPDYMLPSAFVVLDALPLSANGKVDRRALPVPGDIRVGTGIEYLAPRNEGEEQLAQIWAEVLKLDQVGIHDNFFDMGGHSLIATQVVSRMRAQLGIELPLSEMFGYPTVAELAKKIDLIRWTNRQQDDGTPLDREVFRL